MSNTPANKAVLTLDNFDNSADFVQLKASNGSILGWVDSSGVGSGSLSNFARVDVSLSSSDILGLNTTPKSVLPSAPAGFYYNPLYSILKFSAGSLQYGYGSALRLRVGSSVVSGPLASAATIDSATSIIQTQHLSMNSLLKSAVDSGAMYIDVVSTGFASGNGTALVSIFYTIEVSPA